MPVLSSVPRGSLAITALLSCFALQQAHAGVTTGPAAAAQSHGVSAQVLVAASSLGGNVGYNLRKMNGNLDEMDKLLTYRDRPKAFHRQAKEYLEEAELNYQKITKYEMGKFDTNHQDWREGTKRLEDARKALKRYHNEVVLGKSPIKEPVSVVAKTDRRPETLDAPKQVNAAPEEAPKLAANDDEGPLDSRIGHEIGKIDDDLKSIGKYLSGGDRPENRLRQARQGLEEAKYRFDKIKRDYAGKFSETHPDYVAAGARVDAAQAAIAAYKDNQGAKQTAAAAQPATSGKSIARKSSAAEVSPAKTSAPVDNKHIVSPDNRNHSNIMRSVNKFRREIKNAIGKAQRGKSNDDLANAKRLFSIAEKSLANLSFSYGAHINKGSEEYRALEGELAVGRRELAALEPRSSATAQAKQDAKLKYQKGLNTQREKNIADRKAADEKRKADEIAAAKARIVQMDNATFPKQSNSYTNRDQHKMAVAVISGFFKSSGKKLLRLEVEGDFRIEQKSTIKRGFITHATYRYLPVVYALSAKAPYAEVKYANLRNTLQVDPVSGEKKWSPAQVMASHSNFQMRAAKVDD